MTIALIAHDGKKADMVAFVMKRLDFFKKVHIVATGTTGTHVQNAGLVVTKMKSGPLGGDAQIATMITEGKIDAVMFFTDPLDVHPHQVDVSMLLRICNVYDTPLATNYNTARLLLAGLQQETAWETNGITNKSN